MKRCRFCKGLIRPWRQMHPRCEQAVDRMWLEEQARWQFAGYGFLPNDANDPHPIFRDSPAAVTTDELSQAQRRWDQEDQL